MSGLIQARSLLRASRDGPGAGARAVEAFMRVWRAEVSEHFDDEERLLIPLISDAASRDRLLREHAEIRAVVEECGNDPVGAGRQPALLARLGSLLHDHIRWEERVLFEAIQRDHPQALTSLLGEAVEIERVRPGARRRRAIDDGGGSGVEGRTP
ncbi:MAG: hemerythrin domain-containing protein [Phycisphaerales bacterium]|nr:hemerythrin domain-containing protein [Phycisphaerales bacterium]